MIKPNIIFTANNNIGTGLSGGDRIFIELARHWQPKTNLTVIGSAETQNLLRRYHLPQLKFFLTDSIDNSNIFIHQFRRLFKAILFALSHPKLFRQNRFIYTASDFFPDLIFGIMAKMINPKICWIAGYYLVIPPPWRNHTYHPLYYLSQLFSRSIVNILADFVYLTSLPDQRYFPSKKTIIVRGGVSLPAKKTITKKKFEAVFIGRLHPQKGVMELLDIWKLVTQKIPSAKLAIIGDGTLENKLKNKIKNLKLTKNISLLGFLDGEPKNNIFRQSKIVVHPAVFDSGGMAAAEAMALGLPGVSFDLEALKTYYPQGMVKTPTFNHTLFAQNIVNLLINKKLYKQTSVQALNLITKEWSWPKRADIIYRQTFGTQQ